MTATQALVADVGSLLQDFVSATAADAPLKFETLGALWASRNFSFVHFVGDTSKRAKAKVPTQASKYVTEVLFMSILEHLLRPGRRIGNKSAHKSPPQCAGQPDAQARRGSTDPRVPRAAASGSDASNQQQSVTNPLQAPADALAQAPPTATSADPAGVTVPDGMDEEAGAHMDQMQTYPSTGQACAPSRCPHANTAGSSSAPCSLVRASSHPFLQPIRRKRARRDAAEEFPTAAPPVAPAGGGGSEDSISEAHGQLAERVAAVYALYLAFYTQQCEPRVLIHCGPDCVLALRRVLKDMKDHAVSDGVAILQRLVQHAAFVWSHTNLVPRGTAEARQRTSGSHDSQPTSAAITEDAVRKSLIHLRQVVPPGTDLQGAFEEYKADLGRVFGMEPECVNTMIDDVLPGVVRERWKGVVSGVRECLETPRQPASKRRKAAAGLTEWDAGVDNELDQTLEDDEDAECPVNSRPPVLPGAGSSSMSKVVRVLNMGRQRQQRRMAVEQMWIQFVENRHGRQEGQAAGLADSSDEGSLAYEPSNASEDGEDGEALPPAHGVGGVMAAGPSGPVDEQACAPAGAAEVP